MTRLRVYGSAWPMPNVLPLPMAVDNYGWLIVTDAQGSAKPDAIVVDPTLAAPVLTALKRHDVRLRAIWATHHHNDHIAGIPDVVAAQPEPIEVWGSEHDSAAGRIKGQTHALRHNQALACAGLAVRVLCVPGHTLGAIALHVPALGALFTGDTLFAGGCGRLFEGDGPMLWQSLQLLRGLPGATKIYCGHEYTVKNLKFALSLEPESSQIRAALTLAQADRASGRPTVPTTLAHEKRTNPFLRADDPRMLQQLACTDATSAFVQLRQRRDGFV